MATNINWDDIEERPIIKAEDDIIERPLPNAQDDIIEVPLSNKKPLASQEILNATFQVEGIDPEDHASAVLSAHYSKKYSKNIEPEEAELIWKQDFPEAVNASDALLKMRDFYKVHQADTPVVSSLPQAVPPSKLYEEPFGGNVGRNLSFVEDDRNPVERFLARTAAYLRELGDRKAAEQAAWQDWTAETVQQSHAIVEEAVTLGNDFEASVDSGNSPNSYQFGAWNTKQDISYGTALTDREELKRLQDKDAEYEQYAPENAEGFWGKSVQGLAGSLPAMIQTIVLSPTVAGPSLFWQQQGAGSFMRAYLKGKDIDSLSDEELQQAAGIAQVAGIPYAAVELAVRSIPGMKGFGSSIDSQIANAVVRKMTNETRKKIVKEGVAFTIRWLLETAEEGVQGGITEAARQTMESEGIDSAEIWNVAKENFESAIGTTFLMTATGTGGKAMLDRVNRPARPANVAPEEYLTILNERIAALKAGLPSEEQAPVASDVTTIQDGVKVDENGVELQDQGGGKYILNNGNTQKVEQLNELESERTAVEAEIEQAVQPAIEDADIQQTLVEAVVPVRETEELLVDGRQAELVDKLAEMVGGTGGSFEEFVAGYGQPLYHGTPRSGVTELKTGENQRTDFGNMGTGVYLTPSKFIADAYAEKNGVRGDTITAYVDVKNPLEILHDESYKERIQTVADSLGVVSKPEWGKVGNTSKAFADEFATKAQQAGYDAVKMMNVDGSFSSEMVVFDPSKVKTETQLRSLWKQQGKGTDVNPVSASTAVVVDPIKTQGSLEEFRAEQVKWIKEFQAGTIDVNELSRRTGQWKFPEDMTEQEDTRVKIIRPANLSDVVRYAEAYSEEELKAMFPEQYQDILNAAKGDESALKRFNTPSEDEVIAKEVKPEAEREDIPLVSSITEAEQSPLSKIPPVTGEAITQKELPKEEWRMADKEKVGVNEARREYLESLKAGTADTLVSEVLLSGEEKMRTGTMLTIREASIIAEAASTYEYAASQIAPSDYENALKKLEYKRDANRLRNVEQKYASAIAQQLGSRSALRKTKLADFAAEFTELTGTDFKDIDPIVQVEILKAQEEYNNLVTVVDAAEEKLSVAYGDDVIEGVRNLAEEGAEDVEEISLDELRQNAKGTMTGDGANLIITKKHAKAIQALVKGYIREGLLTPKTTKETMLALLRTDVGNFTDRTLFQAVEGVKGKKKTKSDADRVFSELKSQSKLARRVLDAYNGIFDRLQKGQPIDAEFKKLIAATEALQWEVDMLSGEDTFDQQQSDPNKAKNKMLAQLESMQAMLFQIDKMNREVKFYKGEPGTDEKAILEVLADLRKGRSLQDKYFGDILPNLMFGIENAPKQKATEKDGSNITEFYKGIIKQAREELKLRKAPELARQKEEVAYSSLLDQIETALQEAAYGRKSQAQVRAEISDRIKNAKKSLSEATQLKRLAFESNDLIDQLESGEFYSKWTAPKEDGLAVEQAKESLSNLRAKKKERIASALKERTEREAEQKRIKNAESKLAEIEYDIDYGMKRIAKAKTKDVSAEIKELNETIADRMGAQKAQDKYLDIVANLAQGKITTAEKPKTAKEKSAVRQKWEAALADAKNQLETARIQALENFINGTATPEQRQYVEQQEAKQYKSAADRLAEVEDMVELAYRHTAYRKKALLNRVTEIKNQGAAAMAMLRQLNKNYDLQNQIDTENFYTPWRPPAQVSDELAAAKLRMKELQIEKYAIIERHIGKSKLEKVLDTGNILRILASTGEFSVLQIQLGSVLVTNPKIWAGSVGAMLKQWQNSDGKIDVKKMFSGENFAKQIEEMKNDPAFKMYEEAGGVIQDPTAGYRASEEIGQRDKMTSLGGVGTYLTNPLERASALALDYARLQQFKQQIETGKYKTLADRKNLVHVILVSTVRGRAPKFSGNKENGDVASLTPREKTKLLNFIVYSFRMLSAQLEYPVLAATTKGPARMYAVTQGTKAVGVHLGLLAMYGAIYGWENVGLDPEDNKTFMRIKLGETWIAPPGPMLQGAKLFFRSIIYKGGMSIAGYETNVDFVRSNAQFLWNKKSPAMSFLTGMLFGEDFIGRETPRWRLAIKAGMPIVSDTLPSALADRNLDGAQKAFIGLMAMSGANIYTPDEVSENPYGETMKGWGERIDEWFQSWMPEKKEMSKSGTRYKL